MVKAYNVKEKNVVNIFKVVAAILNIVANAKNKFLLIF